MERPGFFARIALACSLFFRLLVDAALAGRVRGLLAAPEPKEAPESAPEPAPEPTPEAAAGREALQLLGALQREGRLVDFVEEDVEGVSDADLGAAARVVHAGCRKVIRGWFAPEPVWPAEEGERVRVESGFDARRVRLVGAVTGEPPFEGTLIHAGWRAGRVDVPMLAAGSDPTVLAPAEVEL